MSIFSYPKGSHSAVCIYRSYDNILTDPVYLGLLLVLTWRSLVTPHSWIFYNVLVMTDHQQCVCNQLLLLLLDLYKIVSAVCLWSKLGTHIAITFLVAYLPNSPSFVSFFFFFFLALVILQALSVPHLHEHIDCLFIQKQGVDPSIRAEVWEFLLGCYALSSTSECRRQLRMARRFGVFFRPSRLSYGC